MLEVHQLFNALDVVSVPQLRMRDRAILALLFTVGLRVHELVGLDVDQIDTTSATVVAVRGANPRESALFVSLRGARLSIRSVERLFEHLRSAVGSRKKITPHTAWHTAATIAIMAGGDVSGVGELPRHASGAGPRAGSHNGRSVNRGHDGVLVETALGFLSAEPHARSPVDAAVRDPSQRKERL